MLNVDGDGPLTIARRVYKPSLVSAWRELNLSVVLRGCYVSLPTSKRSLPGIVRPGTTNLVATSNSARTIWNNLPVAC